MNHFLGNPSFEEHTDDGQTKKNLIPCIPLVYMILKINLMREIETNSTYKSYRKVIHIKENKTEYKR